MHRFNEGMIRLRAGLTSLVVVLAVALSVAQVKGPSTAPRVVVPVRLSDFQVDDLHMVSASVGWAVDGVTGDVLHTAGSVESWRAVDPPGKPPLGYLSPSVFFLGGEHAWAVMAGNGRSEVAVARTTDGGSQWITGPSLDPMSGMDAGLAAGDSMTVDTVTLDFVTSRDGWLAVGLGEEWNAAQGRAGTGTGLVLYRTTDGGAQWSTELRFTAFTTQQAGLSSGCASPEILFTSPTRGWETGACVEQTRDGGITWQKVDPPRPPDISAARWRRRSCSSTQPSFASARVGWLALECVIPSRAGGMADLQVAYQTSDAGAEWVPRQLPVRWPQLPPTYGTLDGPHLGTRAWLLGATAQQLRNAGPGTVSQSLYQSVDGGAHWRLVDPALPASSVDFVSAQFGFAVRACFGAAVGCTNPMLLQTIDGGVNWVQLHPHLLSGRLGPPLPYV